MKRTKIIPYFLLFSLFIIVHNCHGSEVTGPVENEVSTANEILVPESFRQQDPQLVKLILATGSMSTIEKQDWLNLLSHKDNSTRDRLRTILVKEQRDLINLPIVEQHNALLEQAADLLKKQKPNNACERLNQAIDLLPDDATGNDVLVFHLAQELDLEETAITYLEKVVSLQPENSTALSNLAWLYIKNRMFSEAKVALFSAMQLEVTSPYERFNMGHVYLLTGNEQMADRYYLQALYFSDSLEGLYETGLADFDFFIGEGWQTQLCLRKKQSLLEQWQSAPVQYVIARRALLENPFKTQTDLKKQIEVIEELGLTRDPAMLPLLFQAFDKMGEVDFRLQKVASIALQHIAETQTTDLLIVLMHEGQQRTQLWAMQELADRKAVQIIPHLLEWLTDTDTLSEGVQSAIILALGTMGEPSVASKIRPLLHSDFPVVREASIIALGKLKDREAAPQFLAMLKDASPVERQRIINSLEAIDTEIVLPRLFEMLHDEYSIVRSAAFSVHKKILQHLSPFELINYLQHPDISIKRWAVYTLGTMGSESEQYIANAVPALVAALDSEQMSVQQEIYKTLLRFNQQQSVTALQTMPAAMAVPLFSSNFYEETQYLVAEAAWKERKDIENILLEQLIKLSKTDPSDHLEEIIRGMILLKIEAAVPILVSMITTEDTHRTDKEFVIKSLKAFNREYVSAELHKSLNTCDKSVWPLLLLAIGIQGGEENILFLQEKLSHQEENIQSAALLALALSQENNGVDILLSILQDNDNPLRVRAAAYLGRTEDKKTISYLLNTLQIDDTDLQQAAVFSLQELDDKRAVPGLIKLLQNKPEMREEITEALCSLEDIEAAQQLLMIFSNDIHDDLLTNNNKNYGLIMHLERMIRFFSKLQYAQAVPVLIDALNHENHSVRGAAANALGNIGDQRAVKPLEDASNDIFRDIMSEASNALLTIYIAREKNGNG